MALTVDTLLDENDDNFSPGDFSLREAISSSVAGESINFAPGLTGGTVTLTQGELVINKALTISGLGADKLTISGNNASRVFRIADAQSSVVSQVVIAGLTIANGFADDSIQNRYGGGIFNEESLVLTNTVIRDNRALYGGGGISNSRSLFVTNSTINNNFAGLGGGGISSGDIEGPANVLSLSNTTISGNKTDGQGGGIINSDTSRLIVNSSTIYQNTAVFVGGVTSSSGQRLPTSINNTIIAGNLDTNSSNGSHPDVFGTFSTTLFNLIGDSTGSTSFTNGINGNKVGTSTTPLDPKLGALQNNGGSTPTHALLEDSPAIGAANPNATVGVDQRGIDRPRADGLDIGAFETNLQVSIPVVITPPVVIAPPPVVIAPPVVVVVPPEPRRIVGTAKPDVLLGSADSDVIVGGVGGDVMTGGASADYFLYTGVTRGRALAGSQIGNSPMRAGRRVDQITDFNSPEGDRIQLDFDDNVDTVERPSQVYNAGKIAGKRLQVPGEPTVRRNSRAVAIAAAYDDVDPLTPRRQRARPFEGVVVTHKKRTYLSCNDNRAGFNPKRDLVIDVTGIAFQRPQDALAGAILSVSNYFV